MNYRNVEIKLEEAPAFYRPNQSFVAGEGEIIYRATSTAGTSLALNPEDAMAGAKKQIDEKFFR